MSTSSRSPCFSPRTLCSIPKVANRGMGYIDHRAEETLSATHLGAACFLRFYIFLASHPHHLAPALPAGPLRSPGNITETALEQLEMVVEVSRRIKIFADDDDDEAGATNADLARYFPPFLWILRDFALQLVDEDNETEITAREYLEKALRNQTGPLGRSSVVTARGGRGEG